ncbi:hypothetical protein [Psychroflexus torquis]|uniref:hypothetical protein n=1 Tax=Psychroflexus torquis TaxID=57029 RepID=UPI0002FE31A5
MPPTLPWGFSGWHFGRSFLLASTNFFIQLGIVLSMFLGWQFVVGGILLLEKALKCLAFISFMSLLIGIQVKYIFNY